MPASAAAGALPRQLLAWYRRHRRALPWRAAPGTLVDPYPVWVSEVMLQQTQVQTVIPYYRRFLCQFPSLAALARAREAEVLAAWSGLGYYRRARQLHQAAGLVMERHSGAFPLEMAAARALPGVGAYTAGAILSIAGAQAVAALDGNALRIVRRLTGRPLTPPAARQWLERHIPPRRPGDFNQALMDLGALICRPRAPLCGRCPLRRLCVAQGRELPPPPPRRSRHLASAYSLATRGGRAWLRQRPPDARQLAGMWELPPAGVEPGPHLATVRHAITTTRITAAVHAAPRALPPGRWFTQAQAARAPLTGLARKILRRGLGWNFPL
ncbi:MAG: A/G-specific adenine glycosylase [Terriglobales bacterium]